MKEKNQKPVKQKTVAALYTVAYAYSNAAYKVANTWPIQLLIWFVIADTVALFPYFFEEMTDNTTQQQHNRS